MTDVGPTFSDAYPQLRRIGGSANDKASLVEALSAIMENFVDRAFGLDSVQSAQATRNAKGETTRPSRPRRTVPVRASRRSRHRAISISATRPTTKGRARTCRS